MARAGGITNAVNVGIAVQADWENREFISHISLNVRRLFEFLVQFGKMSTPSFLSLSVCCFISNFLISSVSFCFLFPLKLHVFSSSVFLIVIIYQIMNLHEIRENTYKL
uniref:Protein BRICK 1 n=1 Tax=Nelumbo nucifera TaxID=4432 RepID=A0A822ZBN9_NELNU|nr:TPA_asm: hypothetical protein HUJ06_015188 [Nelumbo nucifera]